MQGTERRSSATMGLAGAGSARAGNGLVLRCPSMVLPMRGMLDRPPRAVRPGRGHDVAAVVWFVCGVVSAGERRGDGCGC